MGEKLILDATCGSRSIWFQKNEPHTIFCDKREEEWSGDFCIGSDHPHHKSLSVSPDVICDFTELPFEDESFRLVVFDPPHVENLKETSWFRKEYGSLDGDWKPMIRKGFEECMRVLKYGGVLVFKWSEVKISTREIINVIGQEPLFGHRSGKKMNTHWMCFMKFERSKEKGKWETKPFIDPNDPMKDTGAVWCRCSECKTKLGVFKDGNFFDYCPNCGAKMERSEE